MQATNWAIKAEKEKVHLSEDKILKQYQEFANVFSEEKARRIPPIREENYKIKFVKETLRSFMVHTYKMDKKQTNFIRK